VTNFQNHQGLTFIKERKIAKLRVVREKKPGMYKERQVMLNQYNKYEIVIYV